MVSLRLGSVPVTLGGLMALGMLAYVITGNRTVAYPHSGAAAAVSAPILGVVSARGLAALACYAAVALILGLTR